MSGDAGHVAVEAISDRLAEVTSLAEQLDAVLCGLQRAEAPNHAAPDMKRILDGTASTAPEDWYASGRRPDGARSEDEFVTASECTCTPPSRSSSFHTASLCDSLEADPPSEPEDAVPIIKTTTEVRTGVLVHEVTETTRVRLSRGDTLGVSSFVVTTETLRTADPADDPAKEQQQHEEQASSSSSSGSSSGPGDASDSSAAGDPLLAKMAESREWLQLKVLEVKPDLTRLGASLHEALELQRAHDDVLLQLQSKQSPVEELLRQADQLISTQKPRAEVYAAMADSLGLAWKDVNGHLEQRKLLLDLNVSYHSRAEDCLDRMRALEAACQDSLLPIDIDAVKNLLTRLHDCKRLMLESLMAALQEGRLLLDKLRELASQGTLDSRPDHTRTCSEYAVSQVEHWLEDLHDRRRALEDCWQVRKMHLEQTLALSLLASDLRDLEDYLGASREALSRTTDQLGDSSSSAELLLHEHRKLLPPAKEMQDRALKITKATEQLVSSGHFAVEQATAKAYSVLNSCAEYLDDIEQREALLTRTIAFFRSAHTALTKLDQLEVQLTTTELSSSSPQRAALHSQVEKALGDVTATPLREGHALLDIVGRSTPGSEGVKRTVEEIEDRKITLGQMCTAHREENLKVSQAFTAFLEKQNELYSWLVSIAEAFLQGHQDMGSVLPMAQDFLDLHEQLLSDLQKKGAEVNALLLTLPPILEHLDDEQREDVDQKVDALHSHWVNLKSLLESRIDLAAVYVRFHALAVQLTGEFDELEQELKGAEEGSARTVEQKWLGIKKLYDHLSSTGKTFLEEASKVGDPYLDVKRACLCVETLLEHLGSRQLVVQQSWQTWQSNVVVEREFQVLWESHMTESRMTVDWVSKLDAQLYPVLTSSSTASKVISRELEEKVNAVLPEVKRAQTEIDLRIKTAESLALKGDSHGEKEQLVSKLTEMHNKLQVIMTDYQILLQMLIAFFKNLAELEKTIENLNSQYTLTRLPSALADVELQLKEHEASRQAVLELFKFTQNESEQIITRMYNQEPEEAAKHDAERVRRLLREKREAWEAAWADRKLQLEQHRQVCQFDCDLHQINTTLADLGRQLASIHGQYGESLASARATSQAFVFFEKTIELLEVRIQTFISMGEQLLSSDRASSPHIQQELSQLQSRWAAFHNQVVERRRLVDLSIQYFTLVEEAEEWFREGNKLLVTIVRKSTSVRTPEEATQLLNEVDLFLKPGEAKQDERIRKISNLAYELYGDVPTHQLTLVVTDNREMIDSFTIIRNELSILTQNLKAADELRQRHQKEREEVDATLAAARAEAAAAQAAAAAAEAARKAAEAAAKALQEAPPLIEQETVQKAEAIPLPPPAEPKPEPVVETEKPPTPPPKKVKYVDEQPQPVAPIFTLPLCDAAVPEGDKVTLECRVTGIPMPEVVWYKDGISIQNNPDYQTTFEHGICRLNIEETFTEDSAKFTCTAANSAGTAETSATLSVKEAQPEEQLRPPVFVKLLESGTVREGSSHQLECRVEGVPLPVVQWFKDDVCIDNSPDYLITYNNGEAVLRFEEVFLEDQAKYTCKAANPLDTESCQAKLTVEPLEPTEAPAFTVPLSNVMARAGQKIKLECEVTGLPPPELTWNHNGKLVKETRDLKIQHDGDKATLVVTEAFPKDAGVYVVAARNMAGEATSSCNVSVKGRLPTETSDSELASDMEPTKPSIQMPLKDVCVFEGKRVRLDCIIVGQPEPEVIWYHNDRPVKESDDFKLLFQGDRCSLIIGEVFLEDAGEYKVVAINSGGEASSQCNLSVQTISGEAEPATRQQAAKVVVEPLGTAPKFSKLLTDILVSEGDKVVFECCVEGEPRPTISWLLNNQEITSTDGIQIAEDGKGNVSLTIVKALPSHKGVYTVKASNICGDAKCFANLIVKSFSPSDIKRPEPQQEEKVTPAFKELFADRSILENQSTKFECVITAKPQPKVQWLLNDKPVTGKEFLQTTVGDRHVLTLQRAQKEHCGRYSCIAENEAGKATCVAFLSVMEDYPKDTKPTPLIESSTVSEKSETSSFTMKKSSFMQSSSSQMTQSTGLEPKTQVHSFTAQADHLLKEVDHKPVVEIRSQKIDESHQVNQEKPVVHKHSLLTITNGKEKAQDSLTSDSSTPVSSPKPIRKSVAPRFMTPLMGKIVDQGADVVLFGIIDGYPACEVSWLKNGQPLVPQEGSVTISYKLNKAQLELKNVTVKDGGRYTCTATNPAGSASSTADVVVKKTVFPPVFGRRLQAQMVKTGERVVMEVEATGTPSPTVTWYKDDKQILGAVPGQKFKTKIQGNNYSLIIEKASPEYSGKYMVKATNCCGEAQSIADFLVLEPDVDQDILAHTVVQNVMHTSTQKHEKEEKMSLKVEQQPAPPQVQPAKIETQKVPTYSPLTSLSTPVTSESLHVEEMLKSEKHLSIKMEHHTPFPTVQKPARGLPVTSQKTEPTFADVKTPAPKETEIPITIEGPSVPPKEEPPKPQVTEIKEEVETTGIDTDSITKQTALDFFIGKLKDTKDDSKTTQTQESVMDTGASTTVTDIKTQFETLSTKEEISSKLATTEKEYLPKPQVFPVPQFIPKEPVYGSAVDKQHQISSSMKSEFHTESSSFETRTSQIFTKQSVSQSMEEFNLLPEPPPEICFTPKTEISDKLKLDMPSRAKILEDSQRVLSPVEIPSGAIRIFPSPAKSETSTAEKFESKTTTESLKQKYGPTKMPESTILAKKPAELPKEKEEVCKKEVVEEVHVEKKIHLPGSGDWSYRPTTLPTPHITVPKLPAESKQWTPPVSAATPQPPIRVFPTPQTPKPEDKLPIERPWSSTLESQKQSISSTTKTLISESSTSAFSTVHPPQLKRAASPRPSAEGVAMEKLWTPHKPQEPEPIIPRPMSTGPQRAMSPKPSMEGLAMDKLWAHKHPDSALKRAWPPPQPVEEKPVVPWVITGEPEKVWPPLEKEHEPSSLTTQIIKETEDISRKQTVISSETIKQPPQEVKHYIAEAKYEQSSLMLNNQFQPAETVKETITETRESKRSEEIFSEFHSIHKTSETKESSPPVIEERGLKPSEIKKFWPPGGKIYAEPKAPSISKVSAPKREKPPKSDVPHTSVNGDIHLEPEPPPEMGYAPPPLERRPSYVETIEQNLEKGLDKEPTKHLVGAVRTIPPPPQREKSLTPGPPTPQREWSLPPPLPPKDKAPPPQILPAKPTPKVKAKPVAESKPFESFPELEPFPFKPEPSRPKPSKCPSPPKPSKFIKREFASSDYESDVEMIHIKPKWRPYESDTEEFTYKRVLPPATTPQPKRPKSTELEPLPPSKYDTPPQFDGPPRPNSEVFQTTRSEVTQLTSKTEVKSEKLRTKKRHSPPLLKPGSPPLILQTATSEEKPESSPSKTKPDSPKSKQKVFSMPQQDSGYMADTDEPRTLRMSHHKSTSIRHEESSRTSVEQTTVFSEKLEQNQEQHRTVVQDTTPPVKTQSSFRAHHRHVEHKAEKKVSSTPAAVPAPAKPKELVTSNIVRDVPVMFTQPSHDERASSLEPFPFKTEPARPIAKRPLGPPPPSPSKFVKGEFRESDYESDCEGRIPALWRPIDSDVDEPSYRPVRPVLQTSHRRCYSSMELQSPIPPTEFDNPPQFGGPPRPKFEPIEKPTFIKREKKAEQSQVTVKPKPVAPKAPPLEVIVATPAVKREPPITLKPELPPEIGYAPPPKATYTAHTKVSNFPNATQTETSKVMKFAESTEHSHRIMSVQQTTKVIKFGEKENEPPQLEPFPFKPEQAKPVRRYSGPPPTAPTKFVPGEFRESDYESDYESMRIKPKWTPGGSDSEEPQYRKVRTPLLSRSSSVPTKPVKVPAPMEFESPQMGTPDLSEPKPVVEQDAEQKRLRRVQEMRNRFSETTTQSKTSQQQATHLIIEPGEPPEFGFIGSRIPTATSYTATKHINEMTSTFKSKAKQFVDDIISDVQASKQVPKPEKPILKPVLPKEVPQAKTGDEPQVYREETRVAEHGTKHIDPDTGLIYFKYDFGYEFGIVLPGEGKKNDDDKSPKRPRIDTKKSEDSIDFPVIHEKTGDKTQPKKVDTMSDKAPLFRPKKFTHSKAVKWEPVSESEMSEAEDGTAHKKRYSLPQPPHISIPGASRWDQSTPSPMSLSPSLPSLSPRYPGTAPGPDSAVSPGGSWQAPSPAKVAARGRTGTPTPPSTPSTPGSVTGQLHKPPSFITPLRDIAVVSGQTARFECIVQAEPQPNILWSKNGRIIENSENYQIHYRNGVCRLTIPQAYPEDAGNYTCTATNMFGTIGTSASLQVPGERRSVRKP